MFNYSESPMTLTISFNKLIAQYEHFTNNDDDLTANRAKRILQIGEAIPVLREGFTDISILETYQDEIRYILQDSFSPVLTNNEIKAASIPFEDVVFNSSERFKKIIQAAGNQFELKIKNMPEDDFYIIACSVILNFYYGYNINFKRPFLYEIPDANGIIRYYKILYNADFTEIIPTEKAPKITEEDFNLLLDNFDNIGLSKEKFPPNSYTYKGFVISNIFDVTDDQSISNVKSSLISEKNNNDDKFFIDFQETFRSLFGIKDLKVGFSSYNKEENSFEHIFGGEIESFLLDNTESSKCHDVLCDASYSRLLENNKFLAISDVDEKHKSSNCNVPQLNIFKRQGIKSVILAPIAVNSNLFGILEIVSNKPKILNSINANKLADVMPFIVSAVKRSKREEENLIDAVIQQECTAIHPSVHWKFQKEAKRFVNEQQIGNQATFNKIAFNDVYPLYGQIDIKGSSEARNWATKQDLAVQLNSLKTILISAIKIEDLPIYQQYIYQIDVYLESLENHFQVDSEQQISDFLKNDINLVLEHLNKLAGVKELLEAYYQGIHNELNIVYDSRKKYDDTISKINKRMASLLDKKQEEAQSMYPHYFERFKTDGVEHNMYIGKSITKEDNFHLVYLYNLRLWQLQVMCEMENAYYQMQPNFPVQLDVASMVLVFSQPLSISFRMDEKQFDVDGTYNARYEIVKKRVDKAFVKGTNKRVTEKGKISIVYSQKQDEIEYLKYIKFLQVKKYLDTDVEIVELQDLQAVTGLKAIRVSILYHKTPEDKEFYTYEDLMKEIKA